jgi:hypothetical protein
MRTKIRPLWIALLLVQLAFAGDDDADRLLVALEATAS